MDELNQLQEIFREVLGTDSLNIRAETTAADVPGWDSLNHIMVVVAIEKHFRIKFLAQEVRGWKNVGEICEAIRRKSAAK